MIQNTLVDAESDIISLQDEKTAVVFGPSSYMIDEIEPPFYITLKTNDSMLYNCMLDSGASHNLMPKTIMDHLKLDITRSYHDFYTFDSKRVRCLGLIKDLVCTLAKIPVKSIVLDIVVTDIPPKFRMLLSRSCCAKLGGNSSDGYVLCHYSSLWGRTTKVIQRGKVCAHCFQNRPTKEPSNLCN